MRVKVDDRYMARVFIQQARATKHLSWRATLLAWARKRRVSGRQGYQFNLFGGQPQGQREGER
jgi:hypothetical protein